jgi:hypothetical protein
MRSSVVLDWRTHVLDVAIGDVIARDLEGALRHDLVLDHVLDLFDRDGMPAARALGLDVCRAVEDLPMGEALLLVDRDVGLAHRRDDLGRVELDLGTVALDDLHGRNPSLLRAAVFEL